MEKKLRLAGSGFCDYYVPRMVTLVGHFGQKVPKENGFVRPEDVSLGTHKGIWWRCKKAPDHDWQISVKDCTRYNSGCQGFNHSPANFG